LNRNISERERIMNSIAKETTESILSEKLVTLIATSPNAKTVDDYISTFFPNYNVEEKFNFLKENFDFQVVCGSNGIMDVSQYYGLVIQSILGDIRDFGIKSVIKTKNQ
jgi:hypothetical protein